MVSFGINLQEICRLWPLDSAFDIHGYGELRYNLLGNGGHWMTGVNGTEFNEAAIREVGVMGFPILPRSSAGPITVSVMRHGSDCNSIKLHAE
jgi:hypothetical protein